MEEKRTIKGFQKTKMDRWNPAANEGDLKESYYSRMSNAEKDVTFSLKVMVNQQKNKVLVAEVDSSFADVLLSFLTLPLAIIVKILKKHYGDEAPAFGSLSSLYNGLANLDTCHFRTPDAKSTLLNPPSSSNAAQCTMLKLLDDINVYTNQISWGKRDKYYQLALPQRQLRSTEAKTVASEGVFVINAASFLITDDLQIVSNTGLLQIVSVVGSKEMSKAETMNITFGKAEVMDLLMASLISSTPLTDIILKRREMMSSRKRKYEERISLPDGVGSGNASNDFNLEKMNLKVMVQKSTNKLLYAEAEEDFVEFLFCLLSIPLGGVEFLLGRNSSMKTIDNLYTSIADRIDNKFFMNSEAKNRLIKPEIPHCYISKNQTFLLNEDSKFPCKFPPAAAYNVKFPCKQKNYILGPRTYKVTDDLTMTPFCFVSVLSSLDEMNIQISDVKELKMQIGLKEILSILKASLTSTSALTDALLMNQKSNKHPKQEI